MSGPALAYFPLCAEAGLGPSLLAGGRALRDRLAARRPLLELGADETFDPAAEGRINGRPAIVARLAQARSVLELVRPERILAIGGGCGVELALAAYLRRRHGGLRVLWLDAHGDLNSPASSPSGHFHGMALRFLLEAGLDPVIGGDSAALLPSEVCLVGCRDLDPPEEEYIRARDISILRVGPDARASTRDLFGSFDFAPDDSPVYVHIDLDVLDPSEYPNVKCPKGGGLGIESVARLIARLASRGSLVGASILENTATDARTISRLDPIIEAASAM